MSTNVNQIIEKAVVQVRSILTQAVEQVDESARADLISQFNQAVGGRTITTVKAKRAVRTSAKSGAAQAKKSAKRSIAVKGADKPKRVVSDETKKKLAANLKKARAAKAAKASVGEGVAKKKNGRTAKKK